MDQCKEYISANYFRRFGVEIEINAFDGRNRPIGYEDGALPSGIFEVASIINKSLNEQVIVHKWGHDHYNDSWVVKPDGSCGMEVCTPVMKGYHGIDRISKAIRDLSRNDSVQADSRCSFHVHIDVSDLTETELVNVVAWWIKCEPVFMDSVPFNRKKNHYCQFIGITDVFDSLNIDPKTCLKKIGNCKYYTINTFHYINDKRKTIEIRIMDHNSCLSSWISKNWIRLLIHFVERARQKIIPLKHQPNNPWSGYCWLDPIDVFEFLGFLPEQYELSPGLEQTKLWFLSRLKNYCQNSNLSGILGSESRVVAIQQINKLYSQLMPKNYRITDQDVFGDKFRV